MKKLTIRVDLSGQDLQELMQGEEFNWCFPTKENANQEINIELFNSELSDEDESEV